MKMMQTICFPKGMSEEEAVSMMQRLAGEHDLQIRQIGPVLTVEKSGDSFATPRRMWGQWQSGWLYGTDSVKLLLTSSPVVPGPTVSGVRFLLLLLVLLLLACVVLGMPWDVAVFEGVLVCAVSLIANGIGVSTYEGGLMWENMKKFADALEKACRQPYRT